MFVPFRSKAAYALLLPLLLLFPHLPLQSTAPTNQAQHFVGEVVANDFRPEEFARSRVADQPQVTQRGATA